jgi:hypothetical protein
MSCTCPTSHRDRLQKVRPCFTQGLSEFASLPGAFSIARNGGCEQTLRNLLLDRLGWNAGWPALRSRQH